MNVPPNDSFIKPSTIIKLTEEEVWRKEETYVARGAHMYCTMGTHEEVLNQIENHGVYVNGQSLMTVDDCVVSSSENITGNVNYDEPGNEIDGNLYSFGFCRSLIHPQKVAEINNIPLGQPGGPPVPDGSYIFDVEPESGSLLGNKIYPCVPKFDPRPMDTSRGNLTLATRWSGGSPNVTIQGAPALTTSSCLYCRWAGVIKFLTNGMDPIPPEFLP
ncbi:DUF4280 domain-containing protein [Paenibacillus sp. IHBB 10380]|uniref:DUF4280 domain-containing protein n=1 Tax=Paenibacillus sp. IHBB 10380 TaxID=1566358 RepID=UPI0005CFEF6F|nr:DUF4280 domain-containing protein [Paenibacillus sp. IHBB 10380]AJS61112.1 hypothetical protein UB51_24740 [Paenibacillus sp. IHBB 10380]